MFTSCIANEGKSTITLETARSFAELGKKVLLIDCDLRKSIFKHKIQEGSIKKGLTHYLTGQGKLEDIVYKNKLSKDDTEFYLIPAGPVSSSPTELLASEKFKDMMDKLRSQYDVIIIDTPPLASVVDASIVGAHVDGSVIVVESGGVNYQIVQKVRDKLKNSESRILGVVLNKVDKSRRSYGYYKYGKEYGYGYKYEYKE